MHHLIFYHSPGGVSHAHFVFATNSAGQGAVRGEDRGIQRWCLATIYAADRRQASKYNPRGA
ncbi:hypothetical protein HN011_008809 [Eciton burchellii]|nr:hypothetical protein HN011_008809 [Eciton burchellii]